MYGASRPAGRGKVDTLGAPGRSVGRHDSYVNVAEQFYNSIFDIHVKGVLYKARQSLPLLPEGASIILNSSNRLSIAFSFDVGALGSARSATVPPNRWSFNKVSGNLRMWWEVSCAMHLVE